MPVDDPHFSASVERDGTAAIIAVAGPVDLYAAPELKALLAVELADHRGRVVLDLSETTFVDSTGLAVLVAGHRRAERLGLVELLEDPSRAEDATRADRKG